MSLSSQPSLSGQYFLALSEFIFPGAAALVPLHSFKSSGNHGWVLQIGAIRIRRGTHSCVIFRSTLEIILKGEMHKKDPCSNFVSLHLSTDCKDLDDRLYIEVGDDISRKQIDLLSESLVVEKWLEKLWDEESTLKNMFFFLDLLSTTVFSTEGRCSAVIDIL